VKPLTVHGTCVALSGRGALLRGKPGCGKSDLALRFIHRFEDGAHTHGIGGLIADDQVVLSREGERIVARAPVTIAGKLEVRGIGIVEITALGCASLSLMADLVSRDAVPRLPPDPLPCEDVLGIAVPVIRLDPFEPSAPIKLLLALQTFK
jgi:HPr kinase/phosphorylase